MKKNEIFLVDTNILVYAYEIDDSERKRKSLEILEKCFKRELTVAISIQNLAEFSSVSLKKLKLDASKVKEIIGDLIKFNGFIKLKYSEKTIISAVELSDKNKMSFWDSLLSATMIENGILKIYTENEKDFKISQIEVVNPFNS